MKTYGSGGEATPFLTSALDRGEWLASCPSRFTPRERAHGTHCIGGWVGPRSGRDPVEYRKMSDPAWNLRQGVTRHCVNIF
jgi:hypothetical protein